MMVGGTRWLICWFATPVQLLHAGNRKAGPVSKGLPEELQPWYLSSNSRPFHTLTWNSRDTTQYTWQLACGNPGHTKQLQLGSINKSLKEYREQLGPGGVPPCLHCHACMACPVEGVRMPSGWEFKLYDLLARYWPWVAYQPEMKVLQGRRGAVDVLLTQYKVGVMVDGEHHFPSHHGSHHGTCSKEQQHIDQGFNQAVLQLGPCHGLRGIVRLHHHDYEHWLTHISRAVHMALQPHVHVFVLFSLSYNQAGMVVHRS